MSPLLHVGRSWRGHHVEDACPCPQEPCGLVDLRRIDPACPQHVFTAAKTIRQSHTPEFCIPSPNRAAPAPC